MPVANGRLVMGPGAAEPPDPPPIVAPAIEETRWAELSLHALAGGRRISVGALDAPLRVSGFGPLPREYAGGGFALDLSVARWRFELWVLYALADAPSRIDSSHVQAAVADMGLYLGYDVPRWGGLTGFVLGGVGYDTLMIDARDPHWSWVATQTQVSSDVNTVEQDVITFGVQGSLEQLIVLGRSMGDRSGWGLTLSLRGGYLRQVGDVGWMTTGTSQSVGGMPEVDLSGGWVALGIGVAGFASPAPGTPLARLAGTPR
jgi:hypothetical protein